MKLSKTLITTALLLTTINVIPSIASVAIPAPHERLKSQHLDTTKNIDHFGYAYNKTLFKGADIDKFTITPEVVVTVMDPRFNPETVAEKRKGNDSTRNTKKLIKAIVTKALAKFNEDATESRLSIMIAALQEKGPVVVETAPLGFDKKSEPTSAMSDTAATALFDALKDTAAIRNANARISARKTMATARSAAIAGKRQAGATSAAESLNTRAGIATTFATAMVDLYKDGVLTDSSVDTDGDPVAAYPHIIESIKRLGALQSELTGELARLTKEASSPARNSTSSTPSRQLASVHTTPTPSPAGSSVKRPVVVAEEGSIFDD